MTIDYNAIMTPNGATSGFAELASTVAKIPQIRREQELRKIEIMMQQRRLDNQDKMLAQMGGYRTAMAGAAQTRAAGAVGNYASLASHRDNQDATGALNAETHSDAVANQNQNRDARVAGQTSHWSREDDIAAQKLVETGYANDIRQAVAQIEARKGVPTTQHQVVDDPIKGTHSMVVDRPQEDVDAARGAAAGMVPTRPVRTGARYGQAMGSPGMQAPSLQDAPPAPDAAQPAPQGGPPDAFKAAFAQIHPRAQVKYMQLQQAVLDNPNDMDARQREAAARERILGAAGGQAPVVDAAP